MKRISMCLLSVVLVLSLFACGRVVVTQSDELTTRSWRCETESGMSATLDFTVYEGCFVLYDPSGKELAVIEGALSIDSKNFYITDPGLYRTYTFSYRAFTDRAEVGYMGETLTFYPAETPD